MRPVTKKSGKAFSEVIAKLKSNDPDFTKLSFREIEVNVNPIGIPISHFNDEALSELAVAIKTNQTLKRFEFDGLTYVDKSTKWTHKGIEAIGNALKDHPTLEEIDLTLDQITVITCAEMCEVFQALSGKAKIKNLYLKADLSNNALNSLGKSLAGNTTLESITILSCDEKKHTEYEDEALMTFAAGFAGKSLQHLNLKIKLNDASIELLSQHLSMRNTLKTIILNRCNITPTGMVSITSILKKNPDLTDLDLSNNPLGFNGVKSLADAMPTLLKLKTLSLNYTNLDAQALDYLNDIWRKYNLKIRTFKINNNMAYAYNDFYITVVKKIIENNKYLKILIMNDEYFEQEHFHQLQTLLQDSSKCRLQKFSFGKFIPTRAFIDLLIFTLKRNLHLTFLAPGGEMFYRLHTAWKTNEDNQKKSQQLFIEKAISFSYVYFSPPKDKKELHPSCLPTEIFLLILFHLGQQEAFGMNYEDIVQCAGLIFENFSIRRKLIDEKKYFPIKEINSNSKLELSKWWSLSSRGDTPKRVFRQGTTKDSKVEANQVNSKSNTLQGNKSNEAVESEPDKLSTKCNTM